MAKDKKSFILYSDVQGLINQLPDDVAGRLLKHIYAYVNDENPVSDELLLNVAFEPIKMSLKRDLAKWGETREGRSKAGKASAEAKRLAKEAEQNSTNSTNVDFVQQNSTNSTVSDSVSVSVSDSVNEKNKRKPKTVFTPPVEFEVVDYFKENGYSEQSAKKAFNYYNIANWSDSKGNKIKNWKQKMISVWFKEENKIIQQPQQKWISPA